MPACGVMVQHSEVDVAVPAVETALGPGDGVDAAGVSPGPFAQPASEAAIGAATAAVTIVLVN